MYICCCSVAQLCLIVCDPMDGSTPGLPVLHHLLELAHIQWFISIASLMLSSHLILLCPLLLLPSIFPSIKDFSSELTVHTRLSKYWSFRFRGSPSNESSGLTSLTVDWFDLLAVQRTLRSLLQHQRNKVTEH